MRRATEPPAGWKYFADFLTEEQARALAHELEEVPFRIVEFRGVTAHRQVAHYGWDYAYDARTITKLPDPPVWLLGLRDRVITGLLDDSPARFEEVLVSKYPPGAGIGWHRDAPMFGGTVVGVSLGAPCVMRFRRGVAGAREAYDVTLAPRSVYVIEGAARAQWQHSIPAVEATRYSITFRTVREKWKPRFAEASA